MSDLLIIAVVLGAIAAGVYIIAYERGRQQGWADAREYRDPTDQAAA